MAQGTKSANVPPLGVGAGPDEIVLMDATNLDVDTNLDFVCLGPIEAVEVAIVSSTAKTGTPSVVVSIQAFNPASGLFDTLLTSAAITDTGQTKLLLVGPNVPQVANVSAAHVIRGRMRVFLDYTGTPTTDVLNNVTVSVYSG